MEDVGNDVAKIEKNPPSIAATFLTQLPDTLLPERFLHLVSDRHGHALIASTADEENIRQRHLLGNVQSDEICGEFVQSSVGGYLNGC
jgi:hypothetical protein